MFFNPESENVQLFFFQRKTKPTRIIPVQHRHAVKELLIPRFPENTIEIILQYWDENPFHLKIVRHRHSKSGDFRPAHNGNPARITVNGDLNPSAFLITLIHELAHHTVQKKNRSRPHGTEWKSRFREMMQPFLTSSVFTTEVLTALQIYLKNPLASTSADQNLSRALKSREENNGQVHLEDLSPDAVFRIHNGKTFCKKEKLRKRYRCICLQNQRIYLISPLVPVVPVSREQTEWGSKAGAPR